MGRGVVAQAREGRDHVLREKVSIYWISRPLTEFLVHLLAFPSIYWISRPSTGFTVLLLDFSYKSGHLHFRKFSTFRLRVSWFEVYVWDGATLRRRKRAAITSGENRSPSSVFVVHLMEFPSIYWVSCP